MAWLQKLKTKKGTKYWAIRYYEGGRTRQISTGTVDKSIANKYLHKFESDRRDRKFGIMPKEDQIALDEIHRRRVQYLEANNYSPNTIQREIDAFRMFVNTIRPTMSHQKDLTKSIEEYKAIRMRSGVSPATVNSDLKQIQAMVNWGAARSWCDSIKIKMLKTEKKNPPFLTKEEVTAFFNSIDRVPPPIPKDHPIQDEQFWREYWWMVFRFYFDTGGRKEEVANLRWQDVDLDRCVVVFRARLAKNSQDREVPLSDELVQVLKNRKGDNPQGKIFWQVHSGNWAYRMFKLYSAAAGITDRRKLKLHTIRHTFASWLVRQGVDLKTVQELMGQDIRLAHPA